MAVRVPLLGVGTLQSRLDELIARKGEPPWSETLMMNDDMQAFLICHPPGQPNDTHYHLHDEWWIVLRGEIDWYIEGEPEPIHARAGDFVLGPKERWHHIEPVGSEPTIRIAINTRGEYHRYDRPGCKPLPGQQPIVRSADTSAGAPRAASTEAEQGAPPDGRVPVLKPGNLHARLDDIVAGMGQPPWAYPLVKTDTIDGILICQPPGQPNDTHYHKHDEWWPVLRGEIDWYIEDAPEPIHARAGDFMFGPQNRWHHIEPGGSGPTIRLGIKWPSEFHRYDRPGCKPL